jgi:hypothetical protein
MDNPPGIKNCHLIDIEKDEVGTHGVSIHPNRTFDDNAQWKYQEGLLIQGNGKARATGFGIPVLGRLPKVFVDTYILKCKMQMALRLLDIGTESSYEYALENHVEELDL